MELTAVFFLDTQEHKSRKLIILIDAIHLNSPKINLSFTPEQDEEVILACAWEGSELGQLHYYQEEEKIATATMNEIHEV